MGVRLQTYYRKRSPTDAGHQALLQGGSAACTPVSSARLVCCATWLLAAAHMLALQHDGMRGGSAVAAAASVRLYLRMTALRHGSKKPVGFSLQQYKALLGLPLCRRPT